MSKFLIIRFSSIGDILQCMSVVGGIKEAFPDAEIHWVTRSDMTPILSIDNRINKVWSLNKKDGLLGLLKLGDKLKKEKFDYIYDAHLNRRSYILKMQLNLTSFSIIRTVERSKNRFKRILLFKFGINRFNWPFIGVESFRKPLKELGVINYPKPKRDTWKFPLEVVDKFKNLIDDKTITIAPSANWEMKRWPIEYWQRLIELLPDYKFVILAGPSDTFCNEIYNFDTTRIVNLAGKTNLLESCYIVYISNVIVSGDTGLMHAGDMFGIPTIALIGPTAFGFPKWKNSTILEVNLPCRPCTKDGHGKCTQSVYKKCMMDISPELAAKTVLEKLR